MKTLRTLFLLFICTCATYTKAQNVTIPNPNFKSYLIGNNAINTNGDNEIQISEATAFTGTINCSLRNITDLTGIEAFVNLRVLDCSVNQIQSLNLSQNVHLEELLCFGNWLLNLDVSHNPKLKKLIAYTNGFTTINLNQNPDLEVLAVYFNQINTIDLSQNPNLMTLNIGNNQLSNLDISQNLNLQNLYIYNNQITNLDLSQHSTLFNFSGSNNQLSTLNIKNGNNANFNTFNTSNNPNLTCIEVDDPVFSTNNWTNIDSTTTFSTTCITSILQTENTLENISIYPNPIEDNITIDLGHLCHSVSVKITASTGQTLYTQDLGSTQQINLGVEMYNTGIYFVTIQTEQGTHTSKILKQ